MDSEGFRNGLRDVRAADSIDHDRRLPCVGGSRVAEVHDIEADGPQPSGRITGHPADAPGVQDFHPDPSVGTIGRLDVGRGGSAVGGA